MSRHAWKLCTLVLFAACGAARAGAPDANEPTREGIDFFESKIRPVLVEHCYRCHSAEPDGGKLKGGLRLDTRDGMLKGGESGKPAVVPGQAEASRLVEAIRHTNSELKMPPKKKLGERQVADFVAWINM